jgi:hypothetical protein
MLEVQWLINRTTIRLRRPNRSPEGLAPQICKAHPDFERGRHHEIEYEFSGNRFNAGLAGSDLRERFMLSNLGPGLPGQQDTTGCSRPNRPAANIDFHTCCSVAGAASGHGRAP